MANRPVETFAPWWPPLRVCALLLAAGGAQAIALAWPFGGDFQGHSQGWLQWISLAILAWRLDRVPHRKQALIEGWLFAWAWLLGSTWWLFISMHRYGGLSAPLASLAVALLAAGLALMYALACMGFYQLRAQGLSVLARASAFAALWCLAELTRGTLWTGFPWGAIGYAHLDSVLRHWAPWVGVYGLCALSAFIAMWVAAKRRPTEGRRRVAAMGTLLLAAALSYTWVTSPSRVTEASWVSATPLRVTLLQGNIPQDLKFGEGVDLALRNYHQALMASDSDLTVTPETALPLIQQQLPAHYWQQLEAHFASGERAALIGLPLARSGEHGQRRYSNSAVALLPQSGSAAGASYQYDKRHLVPFGEFVPPLFQWFVQMMSIPLSDFTSGDVNAPSWHFKGERIAPNICYEDLFGEELARSFVDAAQAPTLMVNLSNIAWFGETVAIDQHLNISRMRTMELGRPMLRATNTGATAIINAQGQVTHRLPSAVEGALTAEVYGVHGPVTPYARWASVWGLWPLAIWAGLTLIGVMGVSSLARHKQRRSGP